MQNLEWNSKKSDCFSMSVPDLDLGVGAGTREDTCHDGNPPGWPGGVGGLVLLMTGLAELHPAWDPGPRARRSLHFPGRLPRTVTGLPVRESLCGSISADGGMAPGLLSLGSIHTSPARPFGPRAAPDASE